MSEQSNLLHNHWAKLIDRYGEEVVFSIWPDVEQLIWGHVGNHGRFQWCTPGDEIVSPDGWYGSQQNQEIPTQPWIAVDWDNPTVDMTMGERIRESVRAFQYHAQKSHLPTLAWPSKSGFFHQGSESQHLFVYLPNARDAQSREATVLQLLEKSLNMSVKRDISQPWLEEWGLSPEGHFLYPAQGVYPIRMSLFAARQMDRFIHLWRDTFLDRR